MVVTSTCRLPPCRGRDAQAAFELGVASSPLSAARFGHRIFVACGEPKTLLLQRLERLGSRTYILFC